MDSYLADPESPAAPSAVSLSQLLGLLDLEPLDRAPGEDGRPDPAARTVAFLGQPQPHPEDRVFGGLLLAQALVAAGRTTDGRQRVASLQADFVAGVPTGAPLRWEVERVSDAPSLSTRRSRLVDEEGNELFGALTRWARVRDDLPSYTAARPWDAPSPEDLPDLADRFEGDERIPPWWRTGRPVHFRHAAAPPYLEPVDGGDRLTTHLRATGPLPDDHLVRAALVAYVTDMSVLEAAFVALGAARHAPGARILSLTHALTFHDQPDLGDWHQFDCRVESVAQGRAHGVGELFDGRGRHVATASQLGLVKVAR